MSRLSLLVALLVAVLASACTPTRTRGGDDENNASANNTEPEPPCSPNLDGNCSCGVAEAGPDPQGRLRCVEGVSVCVCPNTVEGEPCDEDIECATARCTSTDQGRICVKGCTGERPCEHGHCWWDPEAEDGEIRMYCTDPAELVYGLQWDCGAGERECPERLSCEVVNAGGVMRCLLACEVDEECPPASAGLRQLCFEGFCQ